MKPGPELNELIAKEVFGSTEAVTTHHYSSALGPAFGVVDKLAEMGFTHFNLVRFRDGTGWQASFNTHDVKQSKLSIGQGKTAPEAICLAALNVVNNKTITTLDNSDY